MRKLILTLAILAGVAAPIAPARAWSWSSNSMSPEQRAAWVQANVNACMSGIRARNIQANDYYMWDSLSGYCNCAVEKMGEALTVEEITTNDINKIDLNKVKPAIAACLNKLVVAK